MPRIYTIGHSTRGIDEFIALLRRTAIELLIDVRRFPGSKRYPHFSKEHLSVSLGRAGIDYEDGEIFGGRRNASPSSPNLHVDGLVIYPGAGAQMDLL